MKNKNVLILVPALIFLLVSCRENEDIATGSLQISETELEIEAEGGSFTVEVTSTSDFSITIPDSWIYLNSENDIYSSGPVSFSVAQNKGTDNRTGYLVFKNLDDTDTLTIKQKGSVDMFHDTFMEYSGPGLYGQNLESFTYKEFSSQYAVRSYTEKGVFDYSILSTEPAKYLVIKNIPSDIEEGDTIEPDILQNISSKIKPDSFSVEKISEGKIWLYNECDRLGIIITEE